VVRLLFLGDVVGASGRLALQTFLPGLKKRYAPDFVLVNGENAAGGYGLTEKVAEEILSLGVDLREPCLEKGIHPLPCKI